MPITSLQNKKCLITGAASGIGRATAIAAAQEGAELFLTDINAPALEKVVAGIRDAGGKVSLYKAMNIADYEAVREFARDIHKARGSMDVLMNIAGISVWGTIDNLEHDQWRRAVEINLMGPIHVMECFIPEMIKARKGGHLVNVSSAAGLFGLPMHAAYSASKFGLRGISEVLRFDLRRHGIGVSLVCPGGVDTGLVNTIEIQGIDPKNPKVMAMKAHFRKRAVTPEQAAAAILKGIRNNRYMVFTSLDIRVGYWFQRKFALPYEIVMRGLNNRLHALLKPPGTGSGG
ncbi:MAG: SDR family oxidoreductase [Stenotrophobium sp.]